MVPVNSAIIQLIDPGVQVAVDRAIHEADEDRFHKRITGVCPYCLTLGEKLARAFRENVATSGIFAEAAERVRRMMADQDEMYRPVNDDDDICGADTECDLPDGHDGPHVPSMRDA